LAFGVSAFLLETLISEDSLRAALCREERDPACFNSGDSSEWRSVKAVVGVLIGIFGSVMRISNVRGLLTDRHSGQLIYFGPELSMVIPGILSTRT
jgi:hypothetical protein